VSGANDEAYRCGQQAVQRQKFRHIWQEPSSTDDALIGRLDDEPRIDARLGVEADHVVLFIGPNQPRQAKSFKRLPPAPVPPIDRASGSFTFEARVRGGNEMLTSDKLAKAP